MLKTRLSMIRRIRFALVSALFGSLLFLTGCSGLDTVGDMMSSITDLFASDDDTADPPKTLPEEFQGEIQVENVME